MRKPQRQVVREAVDEYHERIGKLTEEGRLRMLRIVDEMMARPSSLPKDEVEKEIGLCGRPAGPGAEKAQRRQNPRRV